MGLLKRSLGRELMARLYAKVVGVVVFLVGIAGLFLGDEIAGLLNLDLFEDIFHLVAGALLMYVGFAGSDGAVKGATMFLGIVWVVVGILGFVSEDLYGLVPHGYNLGDNILHLVLGVLGIGVSMSRAETAVPAA